MDIGKIRNFSIIAHIDHGKSTLADRILLQTGLVTEREFRSQFLDDMELERERGITIKAHPVTAPFRSRDGETYQINFIDTPGHVDFSYEVSRSLAACEGVLLVVDASQGIEAQTVANTYLALNHNLAIIPVVNKIDLPSAMPEAVRDELVAFLGVPPGEVRYASAKTGEGVVEILESIVKGIPPPAGRPARPFRGLIFDSVYDDYRGVITYLRVMDGEVKRGDRVEMLASGRVYEITELGIFAPGMKPAKTLSAGQVGFVAGNLKDIRAVKIGDTLAAAGSGAEPLPGYTEPKSMVYCGLYPSASENFESLRKALDRLALNDASLNYAPESSSALGHGFRCGFLGLLHMEIVQERLERESDLDLVKTAPNVTYEVIRTDGSAAEARSPADVPDPSLVAEIREPIVRLEVMIPKEYIGAVMTLAEERRGSHKGLEYIGGRRALLHYEIPFAEIVFDFYDKLKGSTRGYGTMDYEFLSYRPADLVKVDILIHGQPVDALSFLCLREKCEARGRRILTRLRREIPRHMFQVALQAAVGARVVARENISPFRKNVLAKCYGGDVTRKRKLLEKQREGKRRMRAIGNVTVPQNAFLSVLEAREDE
ncbi:MAG: translation elongation factor 4 [Planctomycetota bacterium]|jgi:GTP-binding protein LepA|nr:translation elongation factor 4 [Planctomycetota bacterium]